MRNRPDGETKNELGRALQDLAGRLEGMDIGLTDYLRLLSLRDEVDDEGSQGPLFVGWSTECIKEKSSED